MSWIVAGRNGILGTEHTVPALDGNFASALVAEVFAGGINCLPLGLVNARSTVGIDALIGPLSVGALGDYSILRLAHGGCWDADIKTGGGHFPP